MSWCLLIFCGGAGQRFGKAFLVAGGLDSHVVVGCQALVAVSRLGAPVRGGRVSVLCSVVPFSGGGAETLDGHVRVSAVAGLKVSPRAVGYRR
jgi:hypothetical protein